MPAMIFINNKYTSWYYKIISNAQVRCLPDNTYIEKHHIIPKSLGGTNAPDNIVKLLAREHFICHLLLIKMTENKSKRSMAYAAWQMTNIKGRTSRDRYVPTSKMYEFLKKQLSKTYKGVPKNYASFLNKKHTEETKRKQSKRKQGENNPMYGRTQSADTVFRISLKQKGIPKPRFICEHCGADIGGKSNYIRYHSDNCKNK